MEKVLTMIKVRIRKSPLKEVSKQESAYFGDGVAQLMDDPLVAFDDKNKERLELDGRGNVNRKWMEDNIGPFLGAGHSRAAFELENNPSLVLKIASDAIDGGVFTNKKEIELFNKYPEFFPKVYISDPAGMFFVTEKVDNKFKKAGFAKSLSSNFPAINKIAELLRNDPSRAHSVDNIIYWMWETFVRSDGYFGKRYSRDAFEMELGHIVGKDIAKAALPLIEKDQALSRLGSIIKDYNILPFDLMGDNIATDFETGERFYIIDASIFLDD